MRTTRFQSLLFLFLSIAMFLVPEFRQGLQTLAVNTGELRWLEAAGTLSPDKVEGIARDAESNRDARGVAFAALHTADPVKRRELVEKAIKLDRQ